jgi:hypothetical protein
MVDSVTCAWDVRVAAVAVCLVLGSTFGACDRCESDYFDPVDSRWVVVTSSVEGWEGAIVDFPDEDQYVMVLRDESGALVGSYFAE